MEETPLDAYHRAQQAWPFIRTTEAAHNLPDCLLFAVGMRETNLTCETGDFGHGHGVWQLDDRSHTIPPGFDGDVGLQAVTAGSMLADLLHWAGNRLPWALAAYNAGQEAVMRAVQSDRPVDSVTTGGNYSSAVIAYLLTFHAEHIRELRSTHSAVSSARDLSEHAGPRGRTS